MLMYFMYVLRFITKIFRISIEQCVKIHLNEIKKSVDLNYCHQLLLTVNLSDVWSLRTRVDHFYDYGDFL